MLKRNVLRVTGAIAIGATLLSACASPGESGHRLLTTGGYPPLPRNADLLKPLPVLPCDPEKIDCRVIVSVAALPSVQPGFQTWDCGVRVPEVVVQYGRVTTVRWTLPEIVIGRPAYRFRPDQLPDGLQGITPYSRDALAQYTLVRVSDTVFEFRQRQKATAGYAYGIYLEWLPAGGKDWLPCTPLDPIIINM